MDPVTTDGEDVDADVWDDPVPLDGVPVDLVLLDSVPGDCVAVEDDVDEAALATIALDEGGVDVVALVGAETLSSSIGGATRADTAALAVGALEPGTAALDDDVAGAVACVALKASAP